MKLYDSVLAPNPRRVRIFLAEKGIEVPTVSVDIVKAENRQLAFLAKNPLGGVPVLELDDGTTVSESTAICRYFEEAQPDPPLLGTDARDRAIVEMWLRRVEFEVAFPIMQTFRNTHDFFKGRIPQVPEWAAVCEKQALKGLAWLDGELADRPFVAGDRYTIADITLLIGVDFGRVSDIRIDPEHKNLTRWYGEVSSRPSARA
ncbi:MAG: glutathione S-transferase family protein [Deltaproteobacteria bacterium]|nr:glutathione S-transferase family protein [Deltaproteobacteria bacterium]MBW2578155.1 glutathione S-transferase family protein [Deltaproteobacteria bacterium]